VYSLFLVSGKKVFAGQVDVAGANAVSGEQGAAVMGVTVRAAVGRRVFFTQLASVLGEAASDS
jgi:hypothetical protein